MSKKTCIIIPAFNEQESIGHVLSDIPREYADNIIVVNNGSKDNTAEVAANNGAVVINEPRMGYGSACLAGVSYALENIKPDVLVFLDADYSDFPQDIHKILGKLTEENLEMVIGSRNLGEAEPGSLYLQAKFGNWLATFLLRLFTGYKFTDLGPFRAITVEAYGKLNMVDTNFGWTMEMQIKASKLKMRTGEVSVRYRKRIGISKISGTITGSFKAGYKILYILFKYAF